jgi:hypothetical protein
MPKSHDVLYGELRNDSKQMPLIFVLIFVSKYSKIYSFINRLYGKHDGFKCFVTNRP